MSGAAAVAALRLDEQSMTSGGPPEVRAAAGAIRRSSQKMEVHLNGTDDACAACA